MELSSLTVELRQGLDKLGISWSDLTDFYNDDQYIKYIERTVANPVDDLDRVPLRACIFSYGWVTDNTLKKKASVTKGYPDRIDVWCPEYYPECAALTVDDILDLVVKRMGKD